MEDPNFFDLRIILAAALLSVVSLVFDFLYFTFRRSALANAARAGSTDLDGIGPFVGFAKLAATLRVIFFCSAAVALVYGTVSALLPIVLSPAPL